MAILLASVYWVVYWMVFWLATSLGYSATGALPVLVAMSLAPIPMIILCLAWLRSARRIDPDRRRSISVLGVALYSAHAALVIWLVWWVLYRLNLG